MRWRKLGLVFSPSGERPWMQSHAAVPVPLHIEASIYRVYFTCRDERNRSYVGFLHLDLDEPTKVLDLSDEPALAPGPLGHFDDHGVYGNSLVEHESQLLLYYIGWNPGARRPLFYASIGLAASEDGGKTFERVSTAPVLARSEFDPCFVTSPFVRIEDGVWRMWYASGFRWDEEDGVLRSSYNVKHAESDDGVRWTRDGAICIDNRPGERNIVRPCVLGSYEMWYAFDAGDGYRIGFATSQDGYSWTRRDGDAGIDVSEQGWDSQAIAYPYVFEHDGVRYLVYSGNGFGHDGFGIAVEDS